MFCQKCGNPLPKEGYICKFCGAMMTESQIEKQKNYMQENKFKPKLKSEMYGVEKINYQESEKNSKNLGIFLVLGILIFLIILAIIIYIAR